MLCCHLDPDLETGEGCSVLNGENGTVRGLAFSPDNITSGGSQWGRRRCVRVEHGDESLTVPSLWTYAAGLTPCLSARMERFWLRPVRMGGR